MRDRTQGVLAKSLGAAGVGAALMFFLDPDRGNRRRALLRDKALRLAKNSGASFRKATRDLGNRATGILAETRSRVIGNGSVDDDILVERIRSRMGRSVSHPGAMDVRAQNGVVTLRGDILESEMSGLISSINEIRGVAEVRNELNTYPNDTDIPALQGQNQEIGRNRIVRLHRSPGVRLILGASGGALAFYGAQNRGPLGKVLGAVVIGLLGTEIVNTRLN